MRDPVDHSHPASAEPSISLLFGTWRGHLTWLIEVGQAAATREEPSNPSPSRGTITKHLGAGKEQEVICVIRDTRLEDGQPMAFIFAVDDERLASAETLVVDRTMHDGAWIAHSVLQHSGAWDLRLLDGGLVGTYITKADNRPIKRFKASRMVAW